MRRNSLSCPYQANTAGFRKGLLGVFVTLSSVGAGAIGMTALVLLYPRTPIARLVGSDIAHAVPLTLIAGVGHWLLGSVDWVLLGSLVIGSLPGILFGCHLSARVPDKVLRPVLATILVNRRRAHAASLSMLNWWLGAEKASRDQAGRAPRWRLLEAR
jgi:uncharacterized membrane protein YfcA